MVREGRTTKEALHTPECRARVEAALRDDGDPRVEEANTRFNAHVVERLQAEEEEAAAATPVARYTGPEAATRVYTKRRVLNPEAARRAQEQSAAFAREAGTAPQCMTILRHW